MKSLKWWFAVIMTAITVLAIFLIADTVLIGLIALIISLFSKTEAIQVFKYGVAILFIIEFVLTIPATVKSINKGDKE